MKKEDCFELGSVTRTHGLNGEIKFKLDVDNPLDYEDLEHVLIEIKNTLQPFFIEHLSVQNDLFIVKLEGVDSIEEAEQLKNCVLWLPLSVLPELDDKQFYFHEIIGFTVEDDEKGELGQVSDVFTEIAHPLIAMVYGGKEVLIPANEDIVKTINRKEQKLMVALPEGLLEVYLEDDESSK